MFFSRLTSSCKIINNNKIIIQRPQNKIEPLGKLLRLQNLPRSYEKFDKIPTNGLNTKTVNKESKTNNISSALLGGWEGQLVRNYHINQSEDKGRQGQNVDHHNIFKKNIFFFGTFSTLNNAAVIIN